MANIQNTHTHTHTHNNNNNLRLFSLFATDFVDISLFLFLVSRANWKSTERDVKEREREKIEFHLNFIHFAPTR